MASATFSPVTPQASPSAVPPPPIVETGTFLKFPLASVVTSSSEAVPSGKVRIRTLPLTSNFSVGVKVPIPTFACLLKNNGEFCSFGFASGSESLSLRHYVVHHLHKLSYHCTQEYMCFLE